MNEILKNDYNFLVKRLQENYNQVKVIDTAEWGDDNTYTRYYLNKHENFDRFKNAWREILDKYREEDYDTILDEFDKRAKGEFDYIELGTLNIYTDRKYELEI